MKKNRDSFYILKIKEETDLARKMMNDETIYDLVTPKDKKLYAETQDQFETVIVFFSKNSDDHFIPNRIRITNCVKKSETQFELTMLLDISDKIPIDNFLKFIDLDLNKDFDYNSYFSKDYAIEYLNDFKTQLISSYVRETNIIPFSEYTLNETPAGFAQNDENAIKMWNDSYVSNRKTYQKDRDKIYHSKAFRRLVDKAQIFTSSKGDHYRTRMTHTLEVSQIARSIARKLELNEDLTETIALAHDLGHTPFGHQGERTLNQILEGKIQLIDNVDQLKQSFKHNYQALRVLTFLESSHGDIYGHNISYQVLEGVWKHTTIESNPQKSQELQDFFKYNYPDYLFQNQPFSRTLEGQVVAIADEIAQRSHDIDDAFKSQKLNYESFVEFSNIRKVEPLYEIRERIVEEINQQVSNGAYIINKNDLLCSRICSELVDYFINEVVKQTKDNMKNFDVSKECYTQYHQFDEKIVCFTDESKKACDLLENFISNKVINSAEVSQFDDKAARIITSLFNYYYHHPLSLSDGTLKRIYYEMSKFTNNIVNFRDGHIDIVREEIKKIITPDSKAFRLTPEYIQKRKILVRCIADHISGMTDNYALNEYKKLI